MNTERYTHMVNSMAARPALARGIAIANKIITNAIYIAYPLLLIWLFVQAFSAGDFTWPLGEAAVVFAKALLVPLVSFVLLTFLRKAVNAPRPYEVLDITPVISKDTKGLSFPSRHVFSIFVIAIAFWASLPQPWIGAVIMMLGVALAAARVVSGVHFLRDVLAGAILGVLCGIIGFYLM